MTAFIFILGVSAILLVALYYFYPYIEFEMAWKRFSLPILIILASTVAVWLISGLGFGLATAALEIIVWFGGTKIIATRRMNRIADDIYLKILHATSSSSKQEITSYLQKKSDMDIGFTLARINSHLKLKRVHGDSILFTEEALIKINGFLVDEAIRRGIF